MLWTTTTLTPPVLAGMSCQLPADLDKLRTSSLAITEEAVKYLGRRSPSLKTLPRCAEILKARPSARSATVIDGSPRVDQVDLFGSSGGGAAFGPKASSTHHRANTTETLVRYLSSILHGETMGQHCRRQQELKSHHYATSGLFTQDQQPCLEEMVEKTAALLYP